MDIGIIGGTGPAGSGLALALAASGFTVSIGSREAPKALQTAEGLLASHSDLSLEISGDHNATAALADIVILATPWHGAVSTATSLAAEIEGKVLISMVNAMVRTAKEMQPLRTARGSVAQAVAAAVPSARVVTAFQHLPAARLAQIDRPLEGDVLLCSDHPAASETAAKVVAALPNLRPIKVGSLALAGVIEDFTSVLVNINMKYKVRSSVLVAGIE